MSKEQSSSYGFTYSNIGKFLFHALLMLNPIGAVCIAGLRQGLGDPTPFVECYGQNTRPLDYSVSYHTSLFGTFSSSFSGLHIEDINNGRTVCSISTVAEVDPRYPEVSAGIIVDKNCRSNGYTTYKDENSPHSKGVRVTKTPQPGLEELPPRADGSVAARVSMSRQAQCPPGSWEERSQQQPSQGNGIGGGV